MADSKIILQKVQVRSVKAFKILAAALNMIDEACGVNNLEIKIEDVYYCGWLKSSGLDSFVKTEMEKMLKGMLEEKDV